MPVTPIMPMSQHKKHTALQKAAGAIGLAENLTTLGLKAASLKGASSGGLDSGYGTGPWDPGKYRLMDPSKALVPDESVMKQWAFMRKKP